MPDFLRRHTISLMKGSLAERYTPFGLLTLRDTHHSGY